MESLGYSVPAWLAYSAFVNARYGDRAFASNQGSVLFELATGEQTDAESISQEFRLTSNTDGRFDWIVGAYYKHDNSQQDRTSFIGENFFGAFARQSADPKFLSDDERPEQLVQRRHQLNNYAVFGQLGFKFTDTLKLSVGLRQTWDEKKASCQGLVVETGDRFNPNDPRAVVAHGTLLPFARRCRGDGAVGRAVPGAPNTWTTPKAKASRRLLGEMGRAHAAGHARLEGHRATSTLT